MAKAKKANRKKGAEIKPPEAGNPDTKKIPFIELLKHLPSNDAEPEPPPYRQRQEGTRDE
jgi:hypothetical protein